MNAIQKIARRFGGLTAMARAVDAPVSTVQHWCETGFVPSRRLPEVLRAGGQLYPPIETADFFEPADPAPSEDAA